MVTAVKYFAFAIALSAMLAACSDPSASGPEGETFEPGDYFWPENIDSVHYFVTNTRDSDWIDIGLVRFGSALQAHHHVRGAGDTATMACVRNADSIDATGLTAATLLRLPASMRLVRRVPGASAEILDLAPWSGTTVLAAVKGTGLMTYDTRTDAWAALAAPGLPGITTVHTSHSDSLGVLEVCAFDAASTLLESADGSRTWQRIQLPVPDVVDAIIPCTGMLACARGTMVYISDAPYNTWHQLDIRAEVTCLAALTTNPRSAQILAGTVNGNVAEIDAAYGVPPSINTFSAIQARGIERLFCDANAPFPVLAVAGSTTLWTRIGSSWSPMQSASAAIRDAAQDALSNTMALATELGMLESPLRGVPGSSLVGTLLHSVAMTASGRLVCAGPSGVYHANPGTGVWTTASLPGGGLVELPSALRLLTPGMRVGSSWQCGDLVMMPQDSAGSSHAITARVMHALETLHLSDRTQAFHNVIVVRYAVEDSNGTPRPDALHAVAYYAKGIGPVLVEHYSNGTLTARAEYAPR